MKIARFLIFSIACVLFSTKLTAQDTIFYSMRFSNAVHHESEISITYTNVATPFLKLTLSNYSPGRYANHEFAKNVYGIKAFSAAEEPLKITKTKPNEWVVEVVDGFVKVHYTLFANHANGTYSGIDRRFVHLNMPSAFIWAVGMESRPVKISLYFPDKNKWEVATQLEALKKNEVYVAPNWSYFIDSPVIIGDLSSTEVFSDNKTEISLAMNPDIADSIEDNYAEMVRKIVLEQREVFGEFPAFEYGEYKFLCSYGKGFHPDGMEHRNSTMISSDLALPGNEITLVRALAHEFFHCWNVERLRPQSLEPFDFLNPSVSGELWFGEGFTVYYTLLSLKRAGIYSDSLFMAHLSDMLNYVMLSPGTGKYSPVEMSTMAPVVDASSFNDPTNFHNNFTSYYLYGAVIALALDLELRGRFNLTLDDYMKALWQKYGKEELPYENSDLENVLSTFAGSASFAEMFFDKYIYGTELPDFQSLLLKAGFLLETNKKRTDIARFKYAYADSAIVFKSKPVETSTFYVAGINKNDRILSINGKSFASLEDFYRYMAGVVPGQRLKVVYSHLGRRYEALTLAKPDISVAISDGLKEAKGPNAENQQQFREAWLSSRVKD